MPARIKKSDYAAMFGPSVGDKVRLADTDLSMGVERDLIAEAAGRGNALAYGEEVKFGGGKVIRDGMGQSQVTRADGAVDTVITNALVVDYTGIYKADIGLKDGQIAAIGKAGNPDTQPGVDIIVGPGTEAIAGEGRILTAGGFDSHIHFICPQQIEDALHSGLTTMLGGGTGPAHGTLATTCTPGPWHIGRMLQSVDHFAMNIGVSGKGNASQPEAIVEMVDILGRTKVRGVANTFLSELETLIGSLRHDDGQAEPDSLAEMVHKAKGAAALLGQSELEEHLESLEREARLGRIADRNLWANTLDEGAERARASFDSVLGPESDTPL